MSLKTPLTALTLWLSFAVIPSYADNCQQSFYCYGNSANSVSRVPVRPNPYIHPSNTQATQPAQTPVRPVPNTATNTRPNPPHTVRPPIRPNTTPPRPTTPARVVSAPTRSNAANGTVRVAVIPANRIPNANRAMPSTRPNPVTRLPSNARPNLATARPSPTHPQPNRSTPAPTNKAVTTATVACNKSKQNLLQTASQLENRAIALSRQNKRTEAMNFFNNAIRMRTDANKLTCL
jgi:hypothetical protein